MVAQVYEQYRCCSSSDTRDAAAQAETGESRGVGRAVLVRPDRYVLGVVFAAQEETEGAVAVRLIAMLQSVGALLGKKWPPS